MKKFINLALSMLAIMIVCMSSAAAYSNYNWQCVYEFDAVKLVQMGSGENFDHAIYMFEDGDRRNALLFACHGTYRNNRYLACLAGDEFANYAGAIDAVLQYHIKKGKIRANSFSKVYLISCHAGYAPQKTVTLPNLNRQLQIAIYNKGVQAICVSNSRGNYVHVALIRDKPGAPSGFNPPVGGEVIVLGEPEE